MKDILVNGLKKLGVSVTDDEVSKFIKYKDLLVSWNEKINLTAITEEDEVALKHFIDSLVCIDEESIKKGASVIDVGTGAGFPGLPIKIMRDDIKLTLLDSLNKRLNFLDTVTGELGIDGVTLVHQRAEDGGQNKDLREKFDVAVSRAVANMATLCEYCLPFVKVGGVFIAFKGKAGEEELEEAKKAIRTLGGKCEKVVNMTLPDTDLERTIIFVRKIENTPNKYPRQAGKPSKSPIK